MTDFDNARDQFLSGRFEATSELCNQALALFRDELAPSSETTELVGPQLIEWLDLAAAANFRWGNYSEADRWLGLSLAVRVRAEERLETGLEKLAVVWISLGQMDRATKHLEQAERLKKRYYDPEQPEQLVPTLEAQSALALVSGHYPLAERFARRAVARAPEPGPLASRALTSLARVMWYQDRFQEAQAVCRELLRHEASTPAFERWHWAHAAISNALAGDLPAAQQAARSLGSLSTLRPGHPDPSQLLGWRWLQGQLAWLEGDLNTAVQSWQACRKLAAELYPAVHFQRALLAYSLASALWDQKQHDQAFELAEEVVASCPRHWVGGSALRALGLELLARGYIERRQTARALELSAECLSSLRGKDNRWLVVGAGGVVHWQDRLDEREPGSWLPLCWPLGSLSSERGVLAKTLATRAKALRQGDFEEEANSIASLARIVRESSGSGVLVERVGNPLPAARAVSLRLELSAPGRHPAWISIEDDSGHQQLVGHEGIDGAIIQVQGSRKELLQPDSPLFLQPLEPGRLQLDFLVTSRGSKRAGFMPYLVSLGFHKGPPLRIPVRVH